MLGKGKILSMLSGTGEGAKNVNGGLIYLLWKQQLNAFATNKDNNGDGNAMKGV